MIRTETTQEISTRITPGGPLQLRQLLLALQDDGLISAAQCLALGGTVPEKSTHPLEVIARQGWRRADQPTLPLHLERLCEWLAGHLGMDYLRLDPLKLDLASVTGLVSHAYAARFQFLPLYEEGSQIVVAVTQPYVRDWEDTLTHVGGKGVKTVFCNPAAVRRYLDQFYRLSKSVSNAADKSTNRATVQEQLIELGDGTADAAEDQHIVNIVDWLLQYAFEQRASDIHIEPRRGQGHLRFRIDGMMQRVNSFPDNVMAGVVSRLKILGAMDVSEKRRPQDGRIKSKTPAGAEVELRVSTMPTVHGEKLVIRIFDPDTVLKSFASLGFGADEDRQWQELIKHPNGVILVSGPTGSGKTTTLYSSLKQLARPELNVCTIEDPIEMVEPAFNQTQTHPAIGLTFAMGVRTLLRQDPDIIMVGEIRDQETAEITTQAALTGHLVLSTIHTNDAPTALARLLELGVPSYLIDATLLGVLAQRLLRTLCPYCKKAEAPNDLDQELWVTLTQPDRLPPPASIHKKAGCDECRGTGFKGRIGIYEMMVIGRDIQQLIRPGLDVREVRRLAIRNGMQPLRLAAANKIAEGVTTLEEALRVVPLQMGAHEPG